MNNAPRRTVSDVVGYKETRWGMTPAEIRAAVGQDLHRLATREDFNQFYADHFLPAIEIAGDTFQAVFQLSKKDNRLAQVLLRAEGDPSLPQDIKFQAIEGLLSRKYGPPTLRTGDLSEHAVSQWAFPTTTIELSFLFIPHVISNLTVTYKPTNNADTANL